MSIAITAECYLCHMRRNVEAARSLGDEATATAFARDLMALYLSAPEGASSPCLGPGTTSLFQRYYGLEPDRFRLEKEESNRYILARLDNIRARVASAQDPLLSALQFAIAGNYIDFSALQGEVSFEKLDEMLDEAQAMELSAEVYHSFRDALSQGKTLLYLTDNAGEIGFDRILGEQIHNAYPSLSITFCVRGGPAMNDATREDARLVGIPFPVIDNGTTIAGTELTAIGPEARRAIETADVIFAKGQGNAETLLGCGLPVYYAFLVKCSRFIQKFGKPKLTPLLIQENQQAI